MFRDAFAHHRCIIPASGYYEWLKRTDGRQPYFISAADEEVLVQAETFHGPDAREMMFRIAAR